MTTSSLATTMRRETFSTTRSQSINIISPKLGAASSIDLSITKSSMSLSNPTTATPSDIDSETEDDFDFPRDALGFGGVGTSFDDEYIDNVTNYPFLEASYNHEQMENDESLPERLEWQAMLASVITGEVVRLEKLRLKKNTDVSMSMKEDDLWMELRARMCRRSFEEQKRVVQNARVSSEAKLHEIMDFKVSDPTNLELTVKEVTEVLSKLEYCEQLWQSLQIMKMKSALYRDPDFQKHLEALTTWLTITEWINREIKLLQAWTGNKTTDPTLPPDVGKTSGMAEPNSLVDRIIKQEDLMKIFDEKIKLTIGPVIARAREGHIEYLKEFKKIGLPVHKEGLLKLMMFPIQLIQELVSQRLVYAAKMNKPTPMLIDQTIEDLSLYLNIALLVKERNVQYTAPIQDIDWIKYKPDPKFDAILLNCVDFLFTLSKNKLDLPGGQSHIGIKEIDKFEAHFHFLERVANCVDGGDILVANMSSLLVTKMCSRLLSYWRFQTKNTPSDSNKIEVERWYTHTTERVRKAQRKLLRIYK